MLLSGCLKRYASCQGFSDFGRDRNSHEFGLIRGLYATVNSLNLYLFMLQVRAVCEMKFHFQDKRPPISYVTDLAGNMLVRILVMLYI